MEEKIKELAEKYNIPKALLKEAIQMEKDNIVFVDSRRRLMSKLEEIVVKYSNEIYMK
jgi:acid phosphatase class B